MTGQERWLTRTRSSCHRAAVRSQASDFGTSITLALSHKQAQATFP